MICPRIDSKHKQLNMKIICAGLPKTGTKSVARALTILGFKVYDFIEHFQWHIDEYAQAFDGCMPDFYSMYREVDAVTDLPPCFFWDEIRQKFPDAKVILMERDSPESWVESLKKTGDIIQAERSQLWKALGIVLTPTGRKYMKISAGVWKQFKEKAQAYIEHNERVKSTVPRDQLLVYNVKQGWSPLCEFLGVQIPDVPFPCLNVKSESLKDLLNTGVFLKVYKELVLLSVIFVVILAILVFSFMS